MHQTQNKRMKINTLALYKMIFKFLDKDKKWYLYFGLFITLISSLAYIIGTFLSGTIISSVFTTEAFANPKSLDWSKFWMLSGVTLGCFALYGVCEITKAWFFVRVSYGVSATLRKKAMDNLIDMPISYHQNHKSGDFISTLVNDVNNLSLSLTMSLNQSFSSIFNAALCLFGMVMLSSILSVITLVLSVLFFGVSFFLLKKARPNFINLQNDFGNLSAFLEEALTNTKVTYTFDRQETSKKEFQKHTSSIFKHSIRGDLYSNAFEPWFVMANDILYLVIAAIAFAFKIEGIKTYGLLPQYQIPDVGFIIIFINLVYNFSGTVQGLFRNIFQMQNGVASTVRIFSLVNLQPPKPIENPIHLDNVQGHVKFENVSFRYDTSLPSYQLKKASFEAHPGQKIAIVGPTGAGKTTIISLLSKFFEYEEGTITIDGVDLQKITQSNLRDLMAVVLQDSFMFNDTVYNNLKIAAPNVSDEEIRKACELVTADKFINKLENGYDTVLKNGGLSLSQGERQLLSIARAILGKKKILILDEATSNIDSNTEIIIQKALADEIMKDKTSIIIAHRLSTIKNADLILVVDDGHIIEQGNHKQLMELNGFYSKMYRAQFE